MLHFLNPGGHRLGEHGGKQNIADTASHADPCYVYRVEIENEGEIMCLREKKEEEGQINGIREGRSLL